MTTKLGVTIEIGAQNAASFVLDKVRDDAAQLGATVNRLPTEGPGRLDKLMGKLSLTTGEGVGSMRRLTSSMAFMGLAAVGAEGPLGKLGEGLLLFGGGHAAVLLVATALLGAGLAMKALKGHTEEANKEFDALIEKSHKAFIESQPEYLKFADTQKTIQTAVNDARAAILKAQHDTKQYADLLAGASGDVATMTAFETAHQNAIDRETAAQERLNKALHVLGEARGAHQRQVEDQIQMLRLEADGVGKTAGEMLRMKLEAEHVNEALIAQAVAWVNLRDAREQAIRQQSTDVTLRVMGLTEEERRRQFDRAHFLRGPNPKDIHPVEQLPSGGPSEGSGETGLKRIAMGFLEASQNAQTLNQIIADMATQTLNALADAFTNAFQAAFDGSKNVAAAFAGAMLGAIKQVAKQSGMLALADAAKALAHGILGDPKGFAAAAKFAGAAALYFAVAGGAGALAGGGSGGGGGSGLSGQSFNQQSAAAAKPPLTLVFKGDINAIAPAFVDAVALAIGEGLDRNVIVLREP